MSGTSANHQAGYVAGCVAMNVTSFNITIPPTSFPASTGDIAYPYSLTYSLFNMSSPQDTLSSGGYVPVSTELPNNPADLNANIFTLQNATGSFSPYARRNGTAGIDGSLELMPCDKMPCLQECQTGWAVDGQNETALATCINACLADVPRLECVTSNVTLTTSDGTSAGSSLTAATTGQAWMAAAMTASWVLHVAL
jgi:hypothetical protein